MGEGGPYCVQSMPYSPTLQIWLLQSKSKLKRMYESLQKVRQTLGNRSPGMLRKPHNVIELTSKEPEETEDEMRQPHKDQSYQKII